MRIAMFSLGPLFPDSVHGGAQRNLEAVVRHLAAGGHEVSVFCTRRDDNNAPFRLAETATVHPVLEFRQTFPEPYGVPPYKLANIIEILARAAESHDRFYLNDADLMYDFVYDGLPAVVSFQNFCYATSLAGALSFRGDQLVLNSGYARGCVTQVFQRFRPLDDDRISLVPNGFDLAAMRPVPSAAMRSELGLAADALAVLYPHRPDPDKGIHESLRAVIAAVEALPADRARRVRLLIPVWMDSHVDADGARQYRDLYASIERDARAAGWPDLVHLHPWVGSARMNEYYSLGEVTLCVGSFIETFGNSSIESLLCGTPALLSRVGAHRSILPEGLVAKVDPGDHKAAAAFVLAALRGEQIYPYEQTRSYVAAHYGLDAMVTGYADAILGAARRPPLPALALGRDTGRVRVPAWCAQLGSGYYNDYHHGYVADERLTRVAGYCGEHAVRRADLLALASEEDIAGWIREGHLTPA